MRSANLLTDLGYDSSPNFLQSGSSELATAPAYGHIFRRATGRPLNLLGVYTLRSPRASESTPPLPALYLCSADSDALADSSHRLVWNQDVVPFLVVETPGSFRLYSGFEYDGRHPNKVLRTFNSATELIDAGFHADAINEGTVWGRWGGKLRPEAKVDWKLLEDLKALDRWLRKNDLPLEVSHALIGKYVYLHYLRDRDILSDRKLTAWGISKESVFGRYATIEGLRRVVGHLDEWLNGSVFPVALTGKDAPKTEHVAWVAATFSGDQPSQTGSWQLHLNFKAYNFSYIPIETLSAVYEQFLHAESAGTASRGREVGAYYTPIPVVNFMLAEMEDRRPLSRGVKVLDPSCGSGAFLVQCYRRLIEKELSQSGKAPRPVQLREIVQRSIFGVDRDEDACAVTELSLILTLLDYCIPPDLEGRQFKLPSLRGTNILRENFFQTGCDCFALLGRRKFEWVLGNPPWKRLNPSGLSDEDRPVWEWMARNREGDMPVGGHQVAQAFAWEIERYLADDGHAALLLPAMTLFEDPSKEFRSQFFRRFKVSSIANFSNLAEVLFAGRSRVPAASVFYSRRPSPDEEPAGEHVTTYSPLVANQEPTRPVVRGRRTKTWSLVFNASEVRSVPLEDVLGGSGLPWKLATWGSHLDRRLLDKLSVRFPSLHKMEEADALVVAEGPQLRPSGQGGLERCDEVEDKKVLDVNTLKRRRHIFSFPSDALKRNSHLYIRRGKQGGLAVCRPPHVVVSAARNFAVYTEDYLIVPPRQIGVASPSGDQTLLKAVALYLSSDFAYYHQFLTSTELGVKRDRATLAALRTIPLPLTELPTTTLDAWAALYDRLATASLHAFARERRGDGTLFSVEREPISSAQDVDLLLRELNDSVYDALGLKPRERALVRDLVEVRLALNDGKLGRAAVDPPRASHLKRYGNRLKSELDAFVSEDLAKRHDVKVIHDSNTGMVQVALVRAAEPHEVTVVTADDETAAELQEMRCRLQRKFAQWVYFDRNLQVFEGRRSFVFKPMQRFHWTESQAMFDAAEIISRTLASAGRHGDRR